MALAGESVLPWTPAAVGVVSEVAVMGRTVWLAGDSNVGSEGQWATVVDANTGDACDWSSRVGTGVEAFLPRDTRMYVGGEFSNVGHRSVRGLAVFEP